MERTLTVHVGGNGRRRRGNPMARGGRSVVRVRGHNGAAGQRVLGIATLAFGILAGHGRADGDRGQQQQQQRRPGGTGHRLHR